MGRGGRQPVIFKSQHSMWRWNASFILRLLRAAPPLPTEYKAGWIREPDLSEWYVEDEDLYSYRNSNIGSSDPPNHSPVTVNTDFIHSVFMCNGEWRCNFPCAVDVLYCIWTRAETIGWNKLTSAYHVAHRPSFWQLQRNIKRVN